MRRAQETKAALYLKHPHEISHIKIWLISPNVEWILVCNLEGPAGPNPVPTATGFLAICGELCMQLLLCSLYVDTILKKETVPLMALSQFQHSSQRA